MPTEQPQIIQCDCGQRMRLPEGSQGKVFKCVKCGALIERNELSTRKGSTGGKRYTPVAAAPASDPLLQFFVEIGLINKEQAQTATAELQPFKEKVFETLLRLEMITQDVLYERLSREPGVATISLAHFSIDRHLTQLLPIDIVLRHWVLPIDQLGKSLTAAMVCPMDMEAITAVEKITGLRMRPMLCGLEDFVAAVRKHYRQNDPDYGNVDAFDESVEDIAKAAAPRPEAAQDDAVQQKLVKHSDKKVRETLMNLERLPIPSRVVSQIEAVAGSGEEGLRQVVAAVGGSPQFAASVLTIANSAAYGLRECVDSIPMAVALVGENAVAVLAANTPKIPSSGERQWFYLTRYTKHCADLAAILALDCGRVPPNIAYCAGLLHSLGSYALGVIDPDEYRKIDPRLVGEERLAAEEHLFGLGHTDAGALLCKEWGLPGILEEAARYYLAPGQAKEHTDGAYLLSIATQLATPEGEINKTGMAQCQKAFDFLNINQDEIAAALGKATLDVIGA